MKSTAATQAEGTVIVGGGIAGLAVATALRNVAGGAFRVCFVIYICILCTRFACISAVDLFKEQMLVFIIYCPLLSNCSTLHSSSSMYLL